MAVSAAPSQRRRRRRRRRKQPKPSALHSPMKVLGVGGRASMHDGTVMVPLALGHGVALSKQAAATVLSERANTVSKRFHGPRDVMCGHDLGCTCPASSAYLTRLRTNNDR